jgi:caspase domain-containing protein/pentapeptide repeat protein
MSVNTSNSSYSRRFALVIACSEYEDPSLQKLVAPGQDAEALSMVLKDADIGGFEVTVLKNEPSYRVGREIDMFFSERYRNDLLLLYFSCHGIKDMDGHLYYAARDTNRKYLASTAISANFVNEMMMKSRSKCQMLLLDCCYSGAFAKGMLHKADKIIHTGAQFEEGHGRIIFTASDSMQYSFEGDTCEGVGERSIFTHAIVKGLESGEADIDSNGVISYNDLYNYAYDRVSKNTCMQRPGMWVFGLEGDVIIAKNRMKNKEKKEKHRSELKDELYRVGKKHNTEYLLKLLQKEKVAEFNSIRKIEVDLLLRFCNADLSDKNLIGVDLHEVDLSGAKLVNTKLLMANLMELA